MKLCLCKLNVGLQWKLGFRQDSSLHWSYYCCTVYNRIHMYIHKLDTHVHVPEHG